METLEFHKIPIDTKFKSSNIVTNYKVMYSIIDTSQLSEDKKMLAFTKENPHEYLNDLQIVHMNDYNLVEDYLLRRVEESKNITKYIVRVTEIYVNTIFQFIWIPYLKDFDI